MQPAKTALVQPTALTWNFETIDHVPGLKGLVGYNDDLLKEFLLKLDNDTLVKIATLNRKTFTDVFTAVTKDFTLTSTWCQRCVVIKANNWYNTLHADTKAQYQTQTSLFLAMINRINTPKENRINTPLQFYTTIQLAWEFYLKENKPTKEDAKKIFEKAIQFEEKNKQFNDMQFYSNMCSIVHGIALDALSRKGIEDNDRKIMINVLLNNHYLPFPVHFIFERLKRGVKLFEECRYHLETKNCLMSQIYSFAEIIFCKETVIHTIDVRFNTIKEVIKAIKALPIPNIEEAKGSNRTKLINQLTKSTNSFDSFLKKICDSFTHYKITVKEANNILIELMNAPIQYRSDNLIHIIQATCDIAKEQKEISLQTEAFEVAIRAKEKIQKSNDLSLAVYIIVLTYISLTEGVNARANLQKAIDLLADFPHGEKKIDVLCRLVELQQVHKVGEDLKPILLKETHTQIEKQQTLFRPSLSNHQKTLQQVLATAIKIGYEELRKLCEVEMNKLP